MCKKRKIWIYDIEKICIKPEKTYNIEYPKTIHYLLRNLVTLISHLYLNVGKIVYKMDLEYIYVWQEIFSLTNKLFYQNCNKNVSSDISTPVETEENIYNVKKKNYIEDPFIGSHHV